MPRTDEETVEIINKILAAIAKDSQFQNSIYQIKFASHMSS